MFEVEFVQPIRDKKQIEGMKKVLKAGSLRNYALFVLGINVGLRISDLLLLRETDVKEPNGKISERIRLREKKTGKDKNFPIGETVAKALKVYLPPGPPRDVPIFPSRKGEGPITRQQAHYILNEAARQVGIKDNIGTHTLRKTFGYHAYRAGYPVEVLQKVFNHSSPRITLAYIGITQDEVDEVYMTLNL